MAARSPRRACIGLSALAVLMTGPAAPAAAFGVTPTIVRLAPSGEGATATLAVRNGAERAVSLEIAVDRRNVDAQGAEVREPADADFQLAPVQLTVPASGEQQVHLTYVGETAIAAARAYAVTVRQLPVDRPEGSTGVIMLLNMVAFADVVPPGAAPALDVTASGSVEGLSIVIRNSGTASARLNGYRLVLTDGSTTRTLEPDAWLDPGVSTWILPGGTRRLDVRASDASGLPPGRNWSARLVATGDAG
jgi:P pilus assembly chaperone PapD